MFDLYQWDSCFGLLLVNNVVVSIFYMSYIFTISNFNNLFLGMV